MIFNRLSRSIASSLILSAVVALSTGLTTIHAQTADYDTSFGSGTYGGYEYGGTLDADSPTSTPGSPVTPSEDGNTSGDLPDSGASLHWLVYSGAILSSTGLGLYGVSRRRRRQSPTA